MSLVKGELSLFNTKLNSIALQEVENIQLTPVPNLV